MSQEGNSLNRDTTGTGRESTFLKIGMKTWTAVIIPISGVLIPAIAVIIAAMITVRSNQRPAPPTLSPAPTSSPIRTATPISFTETPSPTPSPSFTNTVTITVAPPEVITLTPAPALIVLLSYDRSAGRPPLTVNFDARESFLIASDGQQYPCKYGACDYNWKVILGSKQLTKSEVDSTGKFRFTFEKKGKYLVTVWICRGKDGVNCAGNGIYIEVG